MLKRNVVLGDTSTYVTVVKYTVVLKRNVVLGDTSTDTPYVGIYIS